MLHAVEGGWYLDRREGNKKVLPEGIRQHSCWNLLWMFRDAEENVCGRQNQSKNRRQGITGKALSPERRDLLLSDLSHAVNQEIHG